MKYLSPARSFVSCSISIASLLVTQAALAQAAPLVSAPAVLVQETAAFTAGTALDETGRARRDHALVLRAGETVDVAMNATFDALVRVQGPSRFALENDDAPLEGTNSRLRFTAPQAGTYVLSATSYAPGEVGWYSLVAQRVAAPANTAPPAPVFVAPPAFAQGALAREPAFDPRVISQGETRGRLFGLFTGVSRYPRGEDTFRGAEDAAELAQTLTQRGVIAPENTRVLTEGDVTFVSLRDTLRELGARMTEHDRLVFYFGGHGSNGALALQEGRIAPAELDMMLDAVPGRQLLLVDACHAGSFEWVTERSPRRVGIFSSTADELSYTATAVHSSGWLIYFVLQAAQGRAHAGSDGVLQLGELADFVRAGYRTHSAPQTLVVHADAGNEALALW